MKFLVLLILSIQLSHGQERYIKYKNGTVVCVDEAYQMGHLNFFTWSMKEILDFLAKDEFLKEKEWKVIEQNPELAMHLKTAADLGLKISEQFCPYDQKSTSDGVYGSDDEVDSIRHFVMSSYLSFQLGKAKARKFMSAHENSEYENSNMMDYYNNELGFNFGESLIKKYQSMGMRRSVQFFMEDVKLEIKRKHELPRGNTLDFMVIKSGPSTCAKRKYPNF